MSYANPDVVRRAGEELLDRQRGLVLVGHSYEEARRLARVGRAARPFARRLSPPCRPLGDNGSGQARSARAKAQSGLGRGHCRGQLALARLAQLEGSGMSPGEARCIVMLDYECGTFA